MDMELNDADLARLRKDSGAHKYDHGHALVLAGGVGHGGAARLAARGALRVGTGAVTLAVAPDAMAENAAQLTAIMLRTCGDAATLANLLDADERLSALCVGPGFGLDAGALQMVQVVVDAGRPAVLDADALTLLSRHRGLFDSLHGGCVLTPHAGEFARVFGDLADDLTDDPVLRADRVAAAARRSGCAVVLKGAVTVVADANGQVAVNDTRGPAEAVPWLATAGSGDVLAGIVTGLLARGLPPFDAARIGVVLHAACARRFGPGLIAEDLADQLPGVFQDMGVP